MAYETETSCPTHALASLLSCDRPGRFCLGASALPVPSALPGFLTSLEVTGTPCPPYAALRFPLGLYHHLERHLFTSWPVQCLFPCLECQLCEARDFCLVVESPGPRTVLDRMDTNICIEAK